MKKDNIDNTYDMLLSCNESELNSMMNDKNQTVYIRVLAKKMLQSDGYIVMDKMVERLLLKLD